MKQRNHLLLAAALVLCLCACGKAEAPEPTATLPTKAAAPVESTAPTQTDPTAPAPAAKEASDFYGTWKIARVSKGGTTVLLEDYIALGGTPGLRDVHFVFREDGSYQFGDRESCEIEQWEVTEDGVVCDGEVLALENNCIVLTSKSITVYFEKVSSSQEFWDVPTQSTHVSEETTVPETTAAASGIRPEFKEAMDSYEAFYDEYAAFMADYKKNPTDFSLLMKYTTMLTKVAEMDEKFNAWDQNDMTPEELKYYLEVNTRIQKKLIDLL